MEHLTAVPELSSTGNLQILGELGRGGMGQVYRARHTSWNLDIAIKHPLPEFVRATDQLKAFQVECDVWASLGLDPYIVTCYYNIELSGLPCVVGEFLPGGSLHEAIHNKTLYRGDEAECLSRLLTTAASTCWGLHRAHQAMLLHCDIKPANILLTEYGTAKIGDFGLAVAFSPSRREGKSVGLTAEFASPEQLRGASLTPSSDVWSWAATMLAAFVGGASWDNGAACGSALRQFLDEGEKAYQLPAIPRGLADLLSECFTVSPDERPSDFGQLAERVCGIHEEVLGEPCPAMRTDLELISADSLNNRAVSRLDLGDLTAARRLLGEALAVDPLHPEANYNTALLDHRSTGRIGEGFFDRLKEDGGLEPGECRPWVYCACLLNLCGRRVDAADCLNNARRVARHQEAQEIERHWALSIRGECVPILAPAISGEDFAHDSARFLRLMGKAETAIAQGRFDDARRYLLMSGDIPGFARHPKRNRLLRKLKP